MPKLQRIKRTNGSVVYSLNIPLELIEQLEWGKGDKLEIEIKDPNVVSTLLIFKEKEEKDG